MKSKRKHIAIFILAIFAGCFMIITLLAFLMRMPASYIWVMDQGSYVNKTQLVKMCPNGTKIKQVKFGQGGAIGIDSQDDSVWAPELNDMETGNFDQIVHIDANGNILNRYPGYRTDVLAVDALNGYVWLGLINEQQIVKLDSNGESILQIPGFPAPASIAVDPNNSSIWIAGRNPAPMVVHLTTDGKELFRKPTPGFFSTSPHQIAVDPRNSDVWYTGSHSGNVYKLSSSGEMLAEIPGFERPVSVSVNPIDGSAWVADYSVEKSGGVVKLDTNGKTISRITTDSSPHVVSVNPFDGSVWVGIDGAMLKLSDEGNLLTTESGFNTPRSLAFSEIEEGLMNKLRFTVTCYLSP